MGSLFQQLVTHQAQFSIRENNRDPSLATDERMQKNSSVHCAAQTIIDIVLANSTQQREQAIASLSTFDNKTLISINALALRVNGMISRGGKTDNLAVQQQLHHLDRITIEVNSILNMRESNFNQSLARRSFENGG